MFPRPIVLSVAGTHGSGASLLHLSIFAVEQDNKLLIKNKGMAYNALLLIL